MRDTMESLGESWKFDQVGEHRMRVAGQTLPRMYVGYRSAANNPDSGPAEYLPLYSAMWPTFTTSGSQARAIVDRLPAIELNSQACFVSLFRHCFCCLMDQARSTTADAGQALCRTPNVWAHV
jgi:hypothetical protein